MTYKRNTLTVSSGGLEWQITAKTPFAGNPNGHVFNTFNMTPGIVLRSTVTQVFDGADVVNNWTHDNPDYDTGTTPNADVTLHLMNGAGNKVAVRLKKVTTDILLPGNSSGKVDIQNPLVVAFGNSFLDGNLQGGYAVVSGQMYE